MNQAVCSNMDYVKRCCPPGVYKSVWDRLVEQLFGAMPIGMDGEMQLPDVDVWKDGVQLLNDEDPYSFLIVTDDSDTPKPGDAILYKGNYYIIGAVE